MKFKIVKKGYSIEEVEKYLTLLDKQNQIDISQYRINISDLKEQIKMLKAKVKEFEEKEHLISKCILKAQEKADEIEYVSKIRFVLEGERLKAFQEKCNNELLKIAYKLRPSYQKEIDEYFEELFNEIDILFRSEFHIKDLIEKN